MTFLFIFLQSVLNTALSLFLSAKIYSYYDGDIGLHSLKKEAISILILSLLHTIFIFYLTATTLYPGIGIGTYCLYAATHYKDWKQAECFTIAATNVVCAFLSHFFIIVAMPGN